MKFIFYTRKHIIPAIVLISLYKIMDHIFVGVLKSIEAVSDSWFSIRGNHFPHSFKDYVQTSLFNERVELCMYGIILSGCHINNY